MEISAAEFDRIARAIAENAMHVLDQELHKARCFPIFETDRRYHIEASILTAARAAMSSVAKALMDGHDVRAALIPDLHPPDEPPPSPL